MSAKARKLGETLEGVQTVTRPDGETVKVRGGLYVLTMAGVYVVDGNEVTVK